MLEMNVHREPLFDSSHDGAGVEKRIYPSPSMENRKR